MEKSKKSAASGVLPVLLIVITFLLSWFWLVPQYKQNQADAAQVSYEVTAVKGKLESLQSAKSTLDSLGTTVDSMFVAIPDNQDTGNIITTLEAIATANSTYVPSFQIGSTTATTAASTATTGLGTVPVSFSINGSFANLTAFIKAVENNLKFFNVQSLTIANGDKTMSMTLQLNAYTQKNTSLLSSALPTTTLPTGQ